MTRGWFHIAKAEFFVLTAGMRKHRFVYAGILYALAMVWAVYVAPAIVVGFIDLLVPIEQLQTLLMVMLPGTMRTVMLLLWMMLLLFPMSYALNEIKIGQWEIFLSNDVKTKDILLGTLMGKMPLYTLIVMAFAPILMSPFLYAFQVSLLGQVLVYLVLIAMVLSTIWLSNWITAIVQARLGESSRGNDLAKALGMVIGIIVIIPMYSMMYMLPAVSEFLGLNVFLLLPPTWSADLVSWLAITYNGAGLTGGQIVGFQDILFFDMLTNSILMAGFGLLTIGAAFLTADRIFTISAGARTEVVTTVKGENFFLRGIRRVFPSSTGVLFVTNMKDFLRKAQNLSKLAYGIILAAMLPVFMYFMGNDWGGLSEMTFFVVAIMSIVGSMPFAGAGFLESKDQLWIIQGTPKGASRFVKTRLVSSFLIVLPVTLIPAIVTSVIMQATLTEFVTVLVLGYLAVCGGVLVSTGVTARNPNYEDTKSPAHQSNMMISVMIPQFTVMSGLFLDIILSIAFDIDVFDIFGSIVPGVHPLTFMALQGLAILLVIGCLLTVSGIRSLSKPEV
jgi:hypothetical protein